MNDRLVERIRNPGRKKILALDGGGILGLISIEVLAEIEEVLRRSLGRGADFRLSEYFDFVTGTSTGAIIATCVSIGMKASEIREFYLRSGKDMFVPSLLIERLSYRYDDEPLARKLKEVLGSGTTLGDPILRTLLMIVTRNATTDSPWPLTNNPFAKYNDEKRPDCNLRIPLWQLVRASTAAPTYFPPETVKVGTKNFIFVDGGVTTYNNPSFLAFVTATTGPYHVDWKTGEDAMLLVSVGTGTCPKEDYNLRTWQMNILHSAVNVPSSLMNAAQAGQDLFCRVFGKCLVGDPIDRELGDLIGQTGPVSPKLFTYLRYDPDTTQEGLNRLGLPHVAAGHVQTLDSVDYIDEIQQVGKALAKQRVKPEHFQGFPG